MRQLGRSSTLACLLLATSAVLPARALDSDKAREIYGPCAACHGEFGAGGKKGEYPRIAGQSAKYLEQQLKAFQNQVRVNLPMYPYTKERELPDEDMKLVSAYLAQIVLPTRQPVFKDSDDALTRLLAMEKVMIVPRAEGMSTMDGRSTRRIARLAMARPARGAACFRCSSASTPAI
jgi:cytochrome c553